MTDNFQRQLKEAEIAFLKNDLTEIGTIIKDLQSKANKISQEMSDSRDRELFYKKIGYQLQEMVYKYERTLDLLPSARVIHENLS